MVLTGRGGFGNYVPSPKTCAAKASPDSPELDALKAVPFTPAPIQHFTSPHQHFTAGRGGYGNKLPVSQMHTMTPAEYLKEVSDALDCEPVRYSVGRGGRGNMVDKRKSASVSRERDYELGQVKTLSSFGRRRSRESDKEDKEGLWAKLRTTLSHWEMQDGSKVL